MNIYNIMLISWISGIICLFGWGILNMSYKQRAFAHGIIQDMNGGLHIMLRNGHSYTSASSVVTYGMITGWLMAITVLFSMVVL